MYNVFLAVDTFLPLDNPICIALTRTSMTYSMFVPMYIFLSTYSIQMANKKVDLTTLPTVEKQRFRIVLTSTNVRAVEGACRLITDRSRSLKVKCFGPYRLPTKVRPRFHPANAPLSRQIGPPKCADQEVREAFSTRFNARRLTYDTQTERRQEIVSSSEPSGDHLGLAVLP